MDPFQWLRPPAPTSDDDICHCPSLGALKLSGTLGTLTYNPVHCMACNGEVPPGRYGPDEVLCRAIAHWRALYGAIDMLWLDSGEYEQWAWKELTNMNSHVNQLGLALLPRMNALCPTYYSYPHDEPDKDDFKPVTNCPVCGRVLQNAFIQPERYLTCENCKIVTARWTAEELARFAPADRGILLI